MGSGINKSKLYERMAYALLIIFISLFALAPMSVYAGGGGSNPMSITVSQVFTAGGDASDIGTADDIFTYRLAPAAEGNPMPEGSAADGYTFDIDGTGSVQIAPITFSGSGLFSYKLSQIIDSEKNNYIYDKRVYILEFNADNDGGIWLIVKNQTGSKVSDISFVNGYYKTPAQQPPVAPVIPPLRKDDNGGDIALTQDDRGGQNTAAGVNQPAPPSNEGIINIENKFPITSLVDVVSQFGRGDVPLGGLGSLAGWSLISAIISILGVIMVVYSVLSSILQRRRRQEDEAAAAYEEEKKIRKEKLTIFLIMTSGLLIPTTWIILDWPLAPGMVWINHWTPVIVILFVMHIMLFIIDKQRRRRAYESICDAA